MMTNERIQSLREFWQVPDTYDRPFGIVAQETVFWLLDELEELLKGGDTFEPHTTV